MSGPLLLTENEVTIPDIVENVEGLYAGDTLEEYLQAMFEASNVTNPYHNIRHGLHMARCVYLAARHHRDELTPQGIRELVIAGMMHDMNHSGRSKPGKDFLEIPRAIDAFGMCIMDEDLPSQEAICDLIRATQFPPPEGVANTLKNRIMQDADMTQAYSVAWVLQVPIGLAKEWDMSVIDLFKGQQKFLAGVTWKTGWAQKTFTPDIVAAKIAEAERFVKMLTKPKKPKAPRS